MAHREKDLGHRAGTALKSASTYPPAFLTPAGRAGHGPTLLQLCQCGHKVKYTTKFDEAVKNMEAAQQLGPALEAYRRQVHEEVRPGTSLSPGAGSVDASGVRRLGRPFQTIKHQYETKTAKLEVQLYIDTVLAGRLSLLAHGTVAGRP